jgi:UDP-N-acetylmuramate dehydrogenase
MKRLSEFTTLEVGGQAQEIASAHTIAEALEHVGRARRKGWPWFVLGGGSNMLVADEGFPGLVLQWEHDELSVLQQGPEEIVVRVGGGMVWDKLVQRTVAEGWAGLECLSGIPGRVGAAPIQNIGAYGQEVAETIRACWVLDWESGAETRIPAEECAFSYRMSRFKGEWKGRHLVTAVEFALRPNGKPTIRYKELQQKIGPDATLAEVRETVVRIRRSKSMVWDESDPNHRSAGSFFVNPIVPAERAASLQEAHPGMPSWPVDQERTKLSAAWLIENSGFPKGWGIGPAGLSSNHVLALINRGGACAADLVRVAGTVRHGVQQRFGVTLHPEPEFLGFSQSVDELLTQA